MPNFVSEFEYRSLIDKKLCKKMNKEKKLKKLGLAKCHET